MQGAKNCPNTTALAIKEGVGRFIVSDEVKKLMKRYGVRSIELWAFYAIFDLPAILSESYFKKSLGEMKDVIDELIVEKQINK